MSEQDLDTRIRALVTRAVADAPAAPEIDPATVFVGRHLDRERHPRRGWWVGGGAALLAAAAAITTVVLVADTDDRITTPSDTTVPSVETTTGPTVPIVVPPVPSPTSTTPPSVVGVPPAFAVTEAGYVAASGPRGVVLRTLAGDLVRRLDQPTTIALPVGDGRVVVQPTSTANADVFDTLPRVWQSDGSITAAPFSSIEWAGPVMAQDVAIVEGRPLLLYVVADPVRGDVIGLLDLSTAATTEVGDLPGPLPTGHRLHLAANGLVAGELSGGFFTTAVPGSPGEVLAGQLNEQAIGSDPGSAPLLTVSPDGTWAAWLKDGELVEVDITPAGLGEERRRALPFDTTGAVDLDVLADGVIVSFGSGQDARYARWDGSFGVLEGSFGTQGPGTLGATPAPPTTTSASTTVPASSTTAPAVNGTSAVVTAGPDGVAVVEDGIEVRRLDQAAESAFLTPGGAVIFQPDRPSPDGDPGDPLIWHADGIDPLLGELGERQSYRLHDVAEVAGVPTVLYGITTRAAGEGAAMDVNEFTEVLHALTMSPTGWTDVVLDEMPTWESGWSQLTLTEDGLVVGEQFDLTEHHLYSVVIPGSPAAPAGPLEAAALGLAASYGDEESPRAYAISHDGTTVAWTFGTDIVVRSLATGEERRWTYGELADVAVRGLDVRAADTGVVDVVVTTGWPQTVEGTSAMVITLRPDGFLEAGPLTPATASFAP